MAWVYLDDQFPDHPKVVAAGGDAAWLWVCAMAYVKRHATEGRIPREVVPRLSDRKQPMKLAATLVKVELWDEHPDGFVVHNYEDWNRSSDARSEAGRKAARARWGRGKSPDDADAHANASDSHSERIESASTNGMPGDAHSLSHPIPSNSLTPPTTSSAPPSHGGDGIEATLNDAAKLLAEAEADRRGNEIGNRAGYVRSRIKTIRDEHEPSWRRILEAEPATTAAQLAEGQPRESEADAAVRAMLERMDRNARQRAGVVSCQACSDRGVVELEDGTFDDCACKTRRTA